MPAAPRLIVLDRDGVVNHDSDAFIKAPAEWVPIDGSMEAIARLTRAGYTVTIATNQSGIGRGLMNRQALYAINRKMRRAVEASGGSIEHIVYCPHRPDEGCVCRKPAPGLLLRLARHFGRSVEDVPVIGDSERDLEAARAVGARPILVRTGNGRATEATLQARGETVETYDDLLAAARQLSTEREEST